MNVEARLAAFGADTPKCPPRAPLAWRQDGAPASRSGTGSPRFASRAERVAAAAIVIVALVTLAGIVILWPGDVDAPIAEGLAAPTERAEVESVSTSQCPPPQPGTCGEATIRLQSGPDDGSTATVQLGGAGVAPELDVGDVVRVTAAASPAETATSGTQPHTAPPQPSATSTYTISDFERRAPMLWLAAAFVVLVVAFGRLRGALSLVGLAVSLAIILAFVVPAILDGEEPVAVAVVGSLAVMLATISLAHGLGPKSLAAMLGTSLSLLLVAGLAVAFAELTHLTGFSSEEATVISLGASDVPLDGLLVAGMVIGALGVLDDVTVSQASTVLALRAANPSQSFGELYRGALRVGRDHVSATVNTLALAYAGASLPVLLLFSSGDLGVLDAANTELVAKEIVAMLVGSIGLIAAVPVTTALAALLARGLPHTAVEPIGEPHAH